MFRFTWIGNAAAMIDDEATRGIYGLLFEEHLFAEQILSSLNLKRSQLGRYRDAHVIAGEIAILTRNGGENRKCPTGSLSQDCNASDCFACIITHRVKRHLHYLRDTDELVDSTYATIYFSIPERDHALLMGFDVVLSFSGLDLDICAWRPLSPERWTEGSERLNQLLEECKKIDAWHEGTGSKGRDKR